MTSTIDLASIMPIAYCDNVEVLQLTQDCCIDVIMRGLPPIFAECGVAAGAHCIIMSNYGKTWAFDSFQGIPEHTKEDQEWTEAHGIGGGDERKSSGITVVGLNDVMKNISRYGGNPANMQYVPGWFVDTLPQVMGLELSLLRLDCDLYKSYYMCFKYLLRRVRKGGYVIIDDYSLSGCQQAIREFGIKEINLINGGKVGYWKV